MRCGQGKVPQRSKHSLCHETSQVKSREAQALFPTIPLSPLWPYPRLDNTACVPQEAPHKFSKTARSTLLSARLMPHVQLSMSLAERFILILGAQSSLMPILPNARSLGAVVWTVSPWSYGKYTYGTVGR